MIILVRIWSSSKSIVLYCIDSNYRIFSSLILTTIWDQKLLKLLEAQKTFFKIRNWSEIINQNKLWEIAKLICLNELEHSNSLLVWNYCFSRKVHFLIACPTSSYLNMEHCELWGCYTSLITWKMKKLK